jgi:hypothetical protein
MPQGPIAAADVNLIPQGAKSVKNITTATVLKPTPGTVLGFSVIVAGSTPGAIHDSATTAGVGAATQVAVASNTVGNIFTNSIPCTSGITVSPGTGQTLAVWYI